MTYFHLGNLVDEHGTPLGARPSETGSHPTGQAQGLGASRFDPARIKKNPRGDLHHSEVALTEEDKALGDDLAYAMGDLWIDENMAPVWQWARVARALRFHGLKIVEA